MKAFKWSIASFFGVIILLGVLLAIFAHGPVKALKEKSRAKGNSREGQTSPAQQAPPPSSLKEGEAGNNPVPPSTPHAPKPPRLEAAGYFVRSGRNAGKKSFCVVASVPSGFFVPSRAKYEELVVKFKASFPKDKAFTRSDMRVYEPQLFTLVLSDGQKFQADSFFTVHDDGKQSAIVTGMVFTTEAPSAEVVQKWMPCWEVDPSDSGKPFFIQFADGEPVQVPQEIVDPPTGKAVGFKFPEIPKIDIPRFVPPRFGNDNSRPGPNPSPARPGKDSMLTTTPFPPTLPATKPPPSQVALTSAVEFPAKVAGKVTGSLKAQVGTVVKVLAVRGDEIEVEYLGAAKRVPIDATDYRSRER